MRTLEFFVLLIVIGSLTATKLGRPGKGFCYFMTSGVRGHRNRQGQLQNGTIISQVPVLSPQERSRQRNNFIDKAGRRIIKLMDFVEGVLSRRGNQPLPAMGGSDVDNEKMAMMKARRTFFSSAARMVQDLELQTKNTFQELIDSAKLLPVVENPRPVKSGRKQNQLPRRKPNRSRNKQIKFANRRRKFLSQKKNKLAMKLKGNRKLKAARKLRTPVLTTMSTIEANGTQ